MEYAPQTSAERMRNSRARRRNGFRIVPIEARESHIDLLMRHGFLAEDDRGDVIAVADAFGAYLDQYLGVG